MSASAAQTRPPLLRGQTMPARLPSLDDAVAAYSFTQGKLFVISSSPRRVVLTPKVTITYSYMMMNDRLWTDFLSTSSSSGSRDAIRRVLADDAQSAPLPPPPAPKQSSTSSPTATVRPHNVHTIPTQYPPLPFRVIRSYLPCHCYRHLPLLSPPQSPVPLYPETLDPLPHTNQSLFLSNRSRHAIFSLPPLAQIFHPTRSPSPSSAITSSLSLPTAGAPKQNVSPSFPLRPPSTRSRSPEHM